MFQYPAEDSELEEGDVIKKVKGDAITEASAFIEKIESMGPEDELELAVERDGKEMEINITLGSRAMRRSRSFANCNRVATLRSRVHLATNLHRS